MTETISETDNNLILLDEVTDYQHHALEIAKRTQRQLIILSQELDFPVYSQEALYSELIQLAKRDRQSQIAILVKDVRPLIERGHRLLQLARRMSSKVEIRKLLTEPENETCAYAIGDKQYLLYKHDDLHYQGFVNYSGAPESKSLLEEFSYLWEQHSYADPSLRQLVI